MSKTQNKDVQVIHPDAYPQMMSRQDAAHAMRVLRSAQTGVRAQVVMDSFVPTARIAVMAQIALLEQAQGDLGVISVAAHEVRGLAEPAGLPAIGRIGDVLCRYLDESEAQSRAVDASIVQLHVSAMLRAAHAEDEGRAAGDTMVHELTQLVNRRLAGN